LIQQAFTSYSLCLREYSDWSRTRESDDALRRGTLQEDLNCRTDDFYTSKNEKFFTSHLPVNCNVKLNVCCRSSSKQENCVWKRLPAKSLKKAEFLLAGFHREDGAVVPAVPDRQVPSGAKLS